MATFMEMLNQGLGGLNTPVGQLGTQLMLASGPQAGNPGGGARLGQAFMGMQQQQAEQQQMQQQMQLRQIQQQEMALRARALNREEKRDMTMEAVLADPNFMNQLSPQQQMAVKMGTPMADVMKIGQAKQATPPGMFDEPQPDGTYVRKVWDPQTGGYKASVPFTPPQAQTANVATRRLEMDQNAQPIEQALKERTVSATEQNAATQAQRVATQQAAELRQRDANVMTNKFKRVEFKHAYEGARSQLSEVATLANEIANDPAIKSLYGPSGYIPPIAGSDAADLQTKIERLKAKGGLAELVKLKNNGVSLTPVSNTDLTNAQTSFANFDKLQSDVQAIETFKNVATSMQKAIDEAAARYNDYDSLYDVPGTSAQQQGPARVTDDNGYNALPSGTEFIGPDGVRRRKP